ncbi:MAG: DUF3575 domain-containing protein [Bacteroidales bacterium]|nr:DUF3575 domain-containing protein [Bacteroidales bacterium]
MSYNMMGQDVAVKTNLLSDGFLNINLGAEMMLSSKWSLEAEGEFNGWTLSHERRWKHWAVQPEIRYWLCRHMDGHFFGAHVHTGQFNMGGLDLDFSFLGTHFSNLKDYRYQGWFWGAGVSYGYAWMLSEHWNLEAELGVGWSYTRFSKYRCKSCNKKDPSKSVHNYVGVTRAAINLVYVF